MRFVILAFVSLVFTAAQAGDFEDGLAASNVSDANEVEKVQAEIKRCFGNEGISNMLIADCHEAAKGKFVAMIENRMDRIKGWFALAESKGKTIALTIDKVILFKSYRERAIELECQLFGYQFEPGIPMCLSDGYGALAKDMDHLERKIKTLAAEQGISIAQHNLGTMYREGKGVAQDYKEALRWYRLAAEQGVVESQFFLGSMHYDGRGTGKDYLRAHMWFSISASGGFERGAKARDLVAGKMSRDQIVKAQEMAKTCLAKKFKNCDDETCDEIVGLMGRAKGLSVICPQRLDGYRQMFTLYRLQFLNRCGSAFGTQYQSLFQEAGDKVRAEAVEIGTVRFCEANRPFGG